jgi:iron complex transport system permease protein
LADPYLLGSASGASLGVALALTAMGGGAGMLAGTSASMMNGGMAIGVFSSGVWVRVGLTGAAFIGAVLAVSLTLMLARGVSNTLRLLLSGVIVGVVLGAMTQLVLLFSPESLQAMQAFMLGSTAFVGWTAATLMLAVWVACVVCAWLFAKVLDGLSLGELTAHSLGLPLGSMRLVLVAVLALATGTAVAQTGLIAFVGLAAPHLVRSLFRSTHGPLLLLSSVYGGVLLMSADVLARGLIAPQELPVGVLTAVIGGLYLLWLMHKPQKAHLSQEG